jgi:hypothetical protein
MKWINLSELFRQPEWPETLTQDQHQRLMLEKLDRVQIYRSLQMPIEGTYHKENSQCLKPL